MQVRLDRGEVVDVKTDLCHETAEQYRKQVSVYAHVLDAEYPDREVGMSLFYTADGESVPVEPL